MRFVWFRIRRNRKPQKQWLNVSLGYGITHLYINIFLQHNYYLYVDFNFQEGIHVLASVIGYCCCCCWCFKDDDAFRMNRTNDLSSQQLVESEQNKTRKNKPKMQKFVFTNDFQFVKREWQGIQNSTMNSINIKHENCLFRHEEWSVWKHKPFCRRSTTKRSV